MAIAVAATFLLYISDSDNFFMLVGIIEGILLLLALVSSQRIWFLQRKKDRAAKLASSPVGSLETEESFENQSTLDDYNDISERNVDE